MKEGWLQYATNSRMTLHTTFLCTPFILLLGVFVVESRKLSLTSWGLFYVWRVSVGCVWGGELQLMIRIDHAYRPVFGQFELLD